MRYELHETFYNVPSLEIVYHRDILKDGQKMPPHLHDNIELLLVKEGILSVICNGVERQFIKNTIVVVNSHQIHEMSPVTDECIYDCLIIGSDIHDYSFPTLPAKSTNPAALDLYNQILYELMNEQNNFRQAIDGYCKVLLATISREKNDDIDIDKVIDKKTAFVQKVISYLYRHLSEDLDLDKISSALNVSKSYLCHVFKSVTGSSPITFLNIIRCNHAMMLLKSGDYNVMESAYASGYINLSYFSKMYKRVIGHSPAADLNVKTLHE